MTKKDFELIAAALKRATPLAQDGQKAMRAWEASVYSVAYALLVTNPLFRVNLFYAACGIKTF